jgi:hypothetical protein
MHQAGGMRGEQEYEAKMRSSERITVAVATRATISAPTRHCLQNAMDGFAKEEIIVVGKPVVAARNELAARARASTNDFILWVDDDASWARGSIARAVDLLHSRRGIDILCGYFSARIAFAPPVATQFDGRQALPASIPVEVRWHGFHWVAMHRYVLDRVGSNPFDLHRDCAEDYSFCNRAFRAGLKMFCATDILVANFEESAGIAFLPNRPAIEMRDDFSLGEFSKIERGRLRQYGDTQIGELARQEPPRTSASEDYWRRALAPLRPVR